MLRLTLRIRVVRHDALLAVANNIFLLMLFLHEPGTGAACFIEVLLDEKAAKLHIPALIAVPRNLSEREPCTCRSFHELPCQADHATAWWVPQAV